MFVAFFSSIFGDLITGYGCPAYASLGIGMVLMLVTTYLIGTRVPNYSGELISEDAFPTDRLRVCCGADGNSRAERTLSQSIDKDSPDRTPGSTEMANANRGIDDL